MKINHHIRKKILKNLRNPHRLIILNEDNFEEIFSFRLHFFNLILVAIFGAISIIICTTILIVFTPLREFIPGYASDDQKQEMTILALKTDSISEVLKKNNLYLNGIKKALNGQVDLAKINKDSILSLPEVSENVDLNPSQAELELRKQIDQQEKNNK